MSGSAFKDIHAEARGRWPSVLSSLGVDKKFLTGRHGPCPMCGGKDRFRFDDKEGKGTWFCSGCGAGNGVALAMAVTGLEFKECVGEIRKLVGTAPVGTARAAKPVEEVRREMNDMWRASVPLSDLRAAQEWLKRRGCLIGGLKELRGLRSVKIGREEYCAMIARYTDASGKPANIHRTFLTLQGEKPDLRQQRMVMPIELPAGGAVRLMEHEHVLGVAEGIETAISASIMHNVPTWATLNANRLEAWIAPEGVSDVVIFGDNDPTFAGQYAAYRLAERLTRKGVRVRVEIPYQPGQDWNDVLMAGLEAA